MSIRDILNTPSEAATTPHGKPPHDRFAAAFGEQAATECGPSRTSQAESLDRLLTIAMHPVSSPPDSARRADGRDKKSIDNESPLREVISMPLAEAETHDDSHTAALTGPTTYRQPGDYELTPRLLAEPDMAWVRCLICSTAFVQQNAYCTRSSCPRCERHSKLYGYVWPKTQREGPRDKEERILDHRTVHRFLALDDELMVRGRAALKKTGTSTPARDDSARRPLTKRARRQLLMDDDSEWTRESSASTTGPDVRRSGRRRTASSKVEA